jgi:DNA-damage-inducible protein J
MEPQLKAEVESLFDRLGLTTTEAITLFYHQVRLRGGLPFPVAVPNEETQRVFEDTDGGRNLIECEDENDLFSRLGL